METKLQIYLVDDSQDMIQKMKDGLRSSKLFEVIGSALNGEQCLHELHAHTIDILVLDLIMPTVDGMEVLDQMPLGRDQRLVVARVGRTVCLLGVSSGGITCLRGLTEEEAGFAGTAPAGHLRILAESAGN